MSNTDDPMRRLEEEVRRRDNLEKAAEATTKARCHLILGADPRSIFFSTLLHNVECKAEPSCETASTNGKVIYYNPEWMLALQPYERIAVLCHEVLHLAMGHHYRQGARDPKLWNIACDLAINPILEEAGYRLPAGAIHPGRGQYKAMPTNLSAEEYYVRLQEQSPPQQQPQDQGEPVDGEGDGGKDDSGQQHGPDPGGCGGIEPPGPTQDEHSQSKADWEVNVAQAEQMSRTKGDLPGCLARVVEAALEPVVDWKEILRRFVSRSSRNDYAWLPPNRRFVWQGLYLPGMKSEELGEVAVAVDTSGSIGAKELAAFASEITGILEAYDCTLTVIYHDSSVQHVQHWKSTDGPFIPEPKGGGGTDHRPVFDWIAEQADQPTCLVCLTDLRSSFPVEAPDYPVLWASTEKDKQGPWGETVFLQGLGFYS